MSETADRRRRTDLDLFILALIASGVSTPYEFQKLAGISQGASVPALRRLVDGGLVRPEDAGSRGRIVHGITPSGRKALRGGCRALVDDQPTGDLDADLRIALLALTVGGNRRAAVEYLRRSADKKASHAGLKRERPDAVQVLARWYSDLKADAAMALGRAEAETIRALADHLPKNRRGLDAHLRPAQRKRKTS